jgi:MFS superfamily sulfate permease-like transporter
MMLVDAFRRLLEPQCEIVGTACDGHALLELAASTQPDVIVLDISMPRLNGMDACVMLRRKMPGVRFVFLTVNEDPDIAAEAISLGAATYVLSSDRIAAALAGLFLGPWALPGTHPVVGATIVTAVFDLDVKTVGALPQGLPKPGLPWTNVHDVLPLLVAAVGITLVSLTDTIATSTSFAARRGEEVDPNQEMIGIGTANLAAGLFQGFAVSTSGSRTAVAEQSGAKSQLTGLVGASCVALMLLFFNSILANLPQAALAAVVISAALALADVAVVRRFARVRKSSLVLSLAAFAGVVFFGVLAGIVLAIALSILLFFRRSWWPHGVVLGRVPDLDGWHDLDRYPDAEQVDSVVVFRWEAPLFFANSGIFRQQVRHLVRRRKPAWLVLQCEAITDVDVTAADMLERLDAELNAQGVQVAFVELRDRLQDLLLRYGLLSTLDREHFYPSMSAALEAIEAETG